jgi:hypothetical protein
MKQRLVTFPQMAPSQLRRKARPVPAKNCVNVTKKSARPGATRVKALVKRTLEAKLDWPEGVEVRPRSLKKF